jgi:hypothetical protein
MKEGSQPNSMISRRKLLVSMSMAAVALGSGSMLQAGAMTGRGSVTGSVYGEESLCGKPLCMGVTLAGLRSNADLHPEDLYFVTDPGREGFFYYDAQDANSPDNDGTILVTPLGKRFKRICDNVKTVTWFGAIGDGSTDSTSAFQKAIDCLGGDGGVVYVPSGVYILSATLQMKSYVVLQGEGAQTILKASQTKGWNESYRAMVELVGTTGAEVRDLVLDQHGSGRNPQIHGISYTMLINDASDCTIDNVLFRDAGYGSSNSNGNPSGPVLLLSAKDSDNTSTGTGGGVGGCRNIRITRCSFVQNGTAGVGFCIRLHSDWLNMKPQFEHYLEHIVIDSCRFEGEYTWNVIEFAGGATRFNKIVNCHFEGRTLSSIDFDKGANHNVASNNTIVNGGKPDMYLTNSATRLACINIHGSGEGGVFYYTHSNSVVNNFIHDCGNDAATDPYEAAIGVEYAQDSLIGGNLISGINKGLIGGGIYIGKGVTRCSIHHNHIRGTRNGIFMNANGSSTNELKLIGNDVQANNYAANLTMQPGGGRNFLVLGNSFRTEGTTNPCVAGGTNSLREPVFAFNHFAGGATGLTLAYANSLAVGNVFRDAQRSVRTYQKAVLIGNVSVGAQSEDILVTSGEPSPLLLGNRFTHPANTKSPVVTYGEAIPGDGHLWAQRDIVYNTNPSSGGTIGWVCVTGGYASVAVWTPATSYAAGAAVHVSDRVYKCTTAGVSGLSALSHTSGNATDGTAKFQYMGSGLAEFKAFGAIEV